MFPALSVTSAEQTLILNSLILETSNAMLEPVCLNSVTLMDRTCEAKFQSLVMTNEMPCYSNVTLNSHTSP